MGAVAEPQSGVAACDRPLVLDPPATAESELARIQLPREPVVPLDAWDDGLAAVPREPPVAEVRLRRDQEPVGLGLTRVRGGRQGVAEQVADGLLCRRVLALPEVVVADVAGAIDEVLGRPVLVVPRRPGAEVVVERNRVVDAELVGVLAHVRLDPLEGELRRVDADDREATARDTAGPSP